MIKINEYEGLLSPYLRRKRFEAALPFVTGKVLDVGCGAGALAKYIDAENYVGVEVDGVSLALARSTYPEHRFVATLNEITEAFDSVVALAVIEHVPDPGKFLRMLGRNLQKSHLSRLIVTTPHPTVDWVHHFGARIGLFSSHADEEHEDLLDRKKLVLAGEAAGLHLDVYMRFLFGANQLAIYKTAE